jgi:hypothetical protein
VTHGTIVVSDPTQVKQDPFAPELWTRAAQAEAAVGLFPEEDWYGDPLGMPSPADVRHRRQDDRLERVVERLAPALMHAMRDGLVDLINEVIADKLPGALTVLQPGRGEASAA